ncbi:MAG: Zinc transporter ZupT [Parcubacteria group bacterium ADurb.Bin247]|nr:MAG: Zinc transporter ZupT [Parcubacteria group bacterium ADurb.Bin247]
MVLLNILIACFLISICVWVAVLFLFFRKETLSKITMFLVSFSAGALIGGAFLHLLPEASEGMEAEKLFFVVLFAFVSFFLIEKLFHWRHCHKENCEVHSLGYMNLVGDSLHNFIDGLVIASVFMVDFKLGITTTLAIALHEIPQEIGDFGVLIHAGFNKGKALVLNYIVATMVILGGVVGYFASFYIEDVMPYLLPIAAGGFIYIASSDLMPEIREETNLKKSIMSFGIFLLGIIFMYTVKFLEH